MQVNGTVVSIEMETTIEGKNKTFPGWELVYRDKKTNEVKSVAKHENTLKYNKQLKAGLEALSPKDDFVMEMVKNDAGYWEPKSVTKGTQAPVETSARPAASVQQSGGNWPTADERAKTQVHIIRQNCVSNAVNFVNISFAKKDQTVDNVLAVAKQFETFIHTGETTSSSFNDEPDFESGIE